MKQLTKNNRNLALFKPVLIAVCGMLCCIVLLNEKALLMISGILIFSLIGYLYGRYRFTKSFDLFYDEKFLYQKKSNELKKIELQDISAIKLTPSEITIMGFRYHQYEIELKNQIHLSEPIRFWAAYGKSTLWDFENHLKEHSPEVIVKHSYSFFDQ